MPEKIKIDLDSLEPNLSFNLKKEAYLYVTAEILLKNGRGNEVRLMEYMEERIKIIEKLINVKRPFIIIDKGKIIMEAH